MDHKLPKGASGLSQVVSTVFPETYEEDEHSSDGSETEEAASPQAFSGITEPEYPMVQLSEDQMQEVSYILENIDEYKGILKAILAREGLEYGYMRSVIEEIQKTGSIRLNEINEKYLRYIFPAMQFPTRGSDGSETEEAASPLACGRSSASRFCMVAFPEKVTHWASMLLKAIDEYKNAEELIEELKKTGLSYNYMYSVLCMIRDKGYIQLDETNEKYVRYFLERFFPTIDLESLQTLDNRITLTPGQDLFSYKFSEEQKAFAKKKALDCKVILSDIAKISEGKIGAADKRQKLLLRETARGDTTKHLEASYQILICIVAVGRIDLRILSKTPEYAEEKDIEALLKRFFIIERR